MPTNCSLATPALPPRRPAAPSAGALMLTLALCLSPLAALAQFTGNSSNDLTSGTSTDVSRIDRKAHV